MNKRVILIVAGVILVAFIGLRLSTIKPRNEPFLAEAPLGDGVHKLRLLKVTDGPLDYDWKDPMPQILRGFLSPGVVPPHVPFQPVHLTGKTRARGTFINEESNGINFLFRAVDSRGRYATAMGLHPIIEFEESTGYVFRPDLFSHEHATWGVLPLTRCAIPRRDKRLRIRIRDRTMRFPASVMEIDNPFFQPDAPVWEGEDLPLSVNAGSLEVTLKSLRLEGSGALRAEVDLSEPGWYGEPFAWMEDATGNVGTHLSPFESAWKVHVRLAPSHFGKQSPEHVWTIPDVAVPDAGGVTALDMTKVIDGVTLRVQSISGGASSGRSESQSSSSAEAPPAGAPSFAIQADADHNKFVVHTRILSNGESIGLGMRTGIGEKQLTIEAPFRLPPEGQKVTLEITCLRKRDVEFLVKPPAELRNALMAEGKAP